MITATEYRAAVPDDSAAIEAALDAAIRDAIENGGSIRAYIMAHWHDDAVHRAMDRYREAGWRVTLVASSDSGDYIELRAP